MIIGQTINAPRETLYIIFWREAVSIAGPGLEGVSDILIVMLFRKTTFQLLIMETFLKLSMIAWTMLPLFSRQPTALSF